MSSVRPRFSKSSKTKQISSENNVHNLRDCGYGRVDHWWHLSFSSFFTFGFYFRADNKFAQWEVSDVFFFHQTRFICTLSHNKFLKNHLKFCKNNQVGRTSKFHFWSTRPLSAVQVFVIFTHGVCPSVLTFVT